MAYLIILTLLFTPAYVIKFRLGPLPTDLLMLWVFFVWIVFGGYLVFKKKLPHFLTYIKETDNKILILTGLFFLAGIISFFIGGSSRPKLGQFIVLLLQPISLFFISRFLFTQNPQSKNYLLTTIYCLLALAGLYSLLQYFTLIGLPPVWWGNSIEPKRAIAFFIHPNFYALWSAPLLALLVPDLLVEFKDKSLKIKDFRLWAWVLGAIGLLLSLSRAGWLGLATAIAVYLIVAANKKIRRIICGAVIIIFIIIFSTPSLRWRFILPFYGEKSSVSRLSLWHTGIKAIGKNPIFGLGLTGFSQNWQRLNTDPNLDTHNFPHNIFLDLWVETGLLGLISFTGLVGIHIYQGLKNRQNIFKLSVALFLIALLAQGIIDNPYFKNDLAMVFWIVLASY